MYKECNIMTKPTFSTEIAKLNEMETEIVKGLYKACHENAEECKELLNKGHNLTLASIYKEVAESIATDTLFKKPDLTKHFEKQDELIKIFDAETDKLVGLAKAELKELSNKHIELIEDMGKEVNFQVTTWFSLAITTGFSWWAAAGGIEPITVASVGLGSIIPPIYYFFKIKNKKLISRNTWLFSGFSAFLVLLMAGGRAVELLLPYFS